MRAVMTVVSDALEPYVGRMVAETCVRATALSIGKTADTLEAADVPALEANIRKLLSPVAPQTAIDDILTNLERGVS